MVPALDEQGAVQSLLPEIISEAEEVIVSDGGSTDDTIQISHSLGARAITGATGRGPQLNLGVANASSEILIFLHADTHLPPEGVNLVRRAIKSGYVGGGFHVQFDDPRPIYRLGSTIVNRRTSLSRIALGDQAQFATRSAFDAIGGFQDWPILEDLDFARRLKKIGKIAIIEARARTSTRRFARGGIAPTIANNWLIFGLYYLGVSPHRLARLYRPKD